jgi:hypothetical protein
VRRMLATARTILLQFHTTRVISAILFTGVIPFLALCAGEGNDRADIFLGSHILSHQSILTRFYASRLI